MMGLISISVVLLLLVIALYVVSFWASHTNRTMEKLSAYECGLEPMGDARIKFEILYYVIGILFLIFDLEIVFLVPLAAILFSLHSFIGFCLLFCFLTILTIGFIYEWLMGALDLSASFK
uniref:NADH-ubiquinone oxidoreductase chain 3 n=1 Tax=Synchytrium taraxaci TaxID=1383262 RepID=A0A4P8NPW4_9FUNG|nr:NADH dehydrogenase subunit 3 [Synchytrium taraxaci]